MRRIVLLVALALLVGAGVYLGIINPKKVRAQAQAAVYGAKSVAGDLMESPGGPSQGAAQAAASCQQNLKRIESAKRAIASRQGVAAGAVSWDAVKRELGGTMPKCAAGGSYSLNSLEVLPTCSVGGAGTIDGSDDHLIRGF